MSGPDADTGPEFAVHDSNDHARRGSCEDRRAFPAENIAKEEAAMSDMLKVIEVLAESDKGWEDAAAEAVKRSSKTLKNIRSIYIENFEGKVEGGKIVRYRVNAKISFVLE
jgi:flavin-binding protein dodecin